MTYLICFAAFNKTLLTPAKKIFFADDETPSLKTDDAHFPWGIGGTTHS